jgi:hypothetical protein
MPYKNKTLQNEAQKRYWSKNKEYYERKKLEYREQVRNKIIEFKQQNPCSCGENHPACLVFHHPDPEEKDFNIADGIKNRWSWDRIHLEIKKCVVLCSNCHMKLHWNEN